MKLYELIAARDELKARLDKGREKIFEARDKHQIDKVQAYQAHWTKLNVQYKRRCIEARFLEALEDD